MITLLIFVVLALGMQVGLFFVIRNKRRHEQAHDVIIKYHINSRADAFRLIQDNNLPEADRRKIEKIYCQT